MARFVLVHGGFHGSWVWGRLTPLLQKAGHTVSAPNLVERSPSGSPLPGPAAEERLSRELKSQPGKAILVAHSAGGPTISTVAEHDPDRVQALVYVSALLIPNGETAVTAFIAKYNPPIPPIDLTPDNTGIFLTDREAGRGLFYNCCSKTDADWALAQLAPDPMVMPVPLQLSRERFGRHRRVYVECLRDQILPIAAARGFREALPCDPVYTLDTDHSPMLSKTAELAAILQEVAGL